MRLQHFENQNFMKCNIRREKKRAYQEVLMKQMLGNSRQSYFRWKLFSMQKRKEELIDLQIRAVIIIQG